MLESGACSQNKVFKNAANVADLQFSWPSESFQTAIGCDGDVWL